MGFISRLLGRQQDGAALPPRAAAAAAHHVPCKRQQPSSPRTGSFAVECVGRAGPPPTALVKVHNVQADSDDEDDTIRVPGSLSDADCGARNSSLGGRRRAAIDISPAAVQRLADKVAVLEAGALRASLDGGSSGTTHAELEALYTDMQLIHRGRASLVYRAREVRSGRRVVVKAYDASRLTPSRRAALERHVRVLRAALGVVGPSGGVVGLERVVENPTGTYVVLQAANGGTLIEAIANAGGRLPERQVAIKVAMPLLRTLSALHERGIVHRDIKPEHLLIHNGGLMVGDWGAAAAMHGSVGGPWQQQQQKPERLHQQPPASPQQQQQQPAGGCCSGTLPPLRDATNFRTGSVEYMAPEMLDKPTASEVFHLVIARGIDEEELPSYDEKVDVWSLGVVVYEALSGLQPFLADSAADMAAAIAAKLGGGEDGGALPAFIQRLPVSDEGKDFVAACLTWDAARRPGAAALLRHPWLASMAQQAAAAATARAATRRASLTAYAGAAASAAAGVAGAPPAPLVDELVAQALAQLPPAAAPSMSSLGPDVLPRSQTAATLEVGLHSVLRTSTQRLEARTSVSRVIAP